MTSGRPRGPAPSGPRISPHFAYNVLTAIALFVRTDPDLARDLLHAFADFTRYASRQNRPVSTVGEEMRAVEHYLLLEQARFGDRLRVTVTMAPETAPAAIPYFCLPPLVDDVVRRRVERATGARHITVAATDLGADALVTVADDAVRPPVGLHDRTAGVPTRQCGVGLDSVRDQLRVVCGDSAALIAGPTPGGGTRVSLRVPK